MKKNEKESRVTSKKIRVSKLRNGAVIDHLEPGSAMKAIEFLGVSDGSTLSIGMFFESKKMGRKDILKIENRTLSPDEINKISILSPEATVCIIKEYKVEKKFKAHLPDKIEGIIRCNNPNCVTNHEKIATCFIVQNKEPLMVRCQYCERVMHGNEIVLI